VTNKQECENNQQGEKSKIKLLLFFKFFKLASQCHLLTSDGFGFKMTFLTNWEDFEKAAERLYLQDPMKVSDAQIIYHASTPVFFMRLLISTNNFIKLH
jgi:hypothetical protein